MIPVREFAPPVVTALVRRQPLSPAKVEFAWRTAAGPALARAAMAELRDDGTILVRTTSAAWATEVERSRALLLARMQEMLGPDVATRLAVRLA
jgi:predicted nucleic acid-binding Zn ribbon protein